MTKEEKFYKALQDVFIGAKIEGTGGFVNLMRIKSNYYRKIEELLKKDIEDALKKYPDFRDELFDKLYSFFSRYFTESGSIYFSSTPFYNNVYEKVYTDDRDVILFWKTRMLYYVKTDRIFRSLEVESDGFKFFFDVSNLEHKKANERRSLIYELKEVKKDKTIVLAVIYSERGRVTKTEDILKELKKHHINITEEQLERAFRIFERQSEVDFFINKNAKAFLQEQFKLWSYQYFWDGAKEWTAERVNQLQILKDIAFKIIDFISQFEDELVKIWNKPKFVKNSNYVVTLDRLNNIDLVEKILNHENISEQIKEWKELGIVDENFRIEDVIETNIMGKQLSKKYEHLPIDTKYFKDLELEILSQFEDLDQALDGWLIKSENYQALNTLLPKFKEKVQTIYIDPPFNLDSSDQFLYRTNYKDANWATLLENRLRIAKDWLNEKGSIFVRCDYNGNWIVRCLMDEIFGKENFRNEITINRKRQSIGTPNKFENESENIFLYSKFSTYKRRDIYRQRNVDELKWTGFLKQGERNPRERIFLGKELYPPKGQHFTLVQEKVERLLKEHFLRLRCKKCGALYYFYDKGSEMPFVKFVEEKLKTAEYFKYKDLKTKYFGVTQLEHCIECNNASDWKVEYLPSDLQKVTDDWKDIPSYSDTNGFPTENSEALLNRVITSASDKADLVLDFFLGSGTTTAVAHKLGRKWIGIEMGQHFYDVILPRMKKVLAYDESGISKEVEEYQGGGFFKYYELEQYEETLANAVYENYDISIVGNKSPYEQYVFLKDEKMLKALEIDYESNKVKIDLSKIYSNIDIAETLSNLIGKWIKKINNSEVEFEDGTKINTKDLDYKLIKPLIWWE